MPATSKRKPTRQRVLGVDGCRAGWIMAERIFQTGEIRAEIFPDWRSILDGPGEGARAVIVDMPIGLAEIGRRACEQEARRRLGARRASVFSSPSRPMLAFSSYAAANAFGKAQGAGLSRQSWNIAPKIKEIDSIITPQMQDRIGEGHPELAFARLTGAPCRFSKKTAEGRTERRRALIAAGFDTIDLIADDLRSRHACKSDWALDDLYDALVLTLTGEARLNGQAWRLGDSARDLRGLKMEIWA